MDNANVRRWPLGDELPQAAAASAIDEADGFWIDAGRRLSDGLRAGAAALACMAAGMAFAYANDEIGSAAAVVDEVPGYMPLAAAQELRVGQPFAANDEIVPQPAAALTFEHDFWPAPTVTVSAPVIRVWSEQDERPTPAASAPIEHDVPVFGSNADDPTFTVWAENDEIVPQAASVGGGILKDEARILRWSQADEWVPAAASLTVDEFYPWRPPTLAIEAPRTLQQVEPDFAAPRVAHEDDGWTFVAAAAWQAPQPFTAGDDIVPQPAATIAVEDDWPGLKPAAVAPTVLLFASDDEIVPQPPSSISFDEEYRWQGVVIPATTATAFAADDDIVPQPAPTIVELDFWSPPLTVAPTTSQPFTSTDDVVPQPPQGQFEDDSWLVVTPAWPAPTFLHLPEPEAIPGALRGVPEDYIWPIPPAPLVPALATMFAVGDDIVPIPLRVDEFYWLTLRAYQVPPFNLVYVWQDEIATGILPDVYTVDSRERVGVQRDRIGAARLGNYSDAVTDRRIGGPNVRVGSGRLGWKKT